MLMGVTLFYPLIRMGLGVALEHLAVPEDITVLVYR
jgi:hypothetical protein